MARMKHDAARRRLLTGVLAAWLAGCAEGPRFAPAPAPTVPARYRNDGAPEADSNLPHQWWLVYRDPVLSDLIETTLRDNPYSDVALMRVAQARAQLGVAAADGQPQLGAGLAAKKSHSSVATPLGRLLGGRTIAGNEFSVDANASWQLDLWKRVAHAVEAAQARVGMARTAIHNVELVLSTEVAVAYWQYRAADADLSLLGAIRAQRAEAVDLLAERLAAGLGDEQGLARAQVELGNVEADIAEANRKRNLAEQELATLAVKPLDGFSVPKDPAYRLPEVPAITPGLPALLLARRPDLAESSQGIRELLAQEKVAETAFYPSIGLTGDFGFASSQLKELLHHDSYQYSLGPLALTLPLFDGGRNRANLELARARYREAVDLHRSKLLIALREVDDALAEIQSSQDQMRALSDTLAASRRLVVLARSRFEEGASSYVGITSVQCEALAAVRRLTRSRTEALLATVRLVGALGGGWTAGDGSAPGGTDDHLGPGTPAAEPVPSTHAGP
jgi:multidrug efflux system outer membrane protein